MCYKRGLVTAAVFLSGVIALIAPERFASHVTASRPPAGSGSGSVKTVTVVVQGFKFDPPIVTVHEGDTVQWKNKDIVPHTATEDVSKPAFDSGKIQMGAAWSFVARSKGTYNYICTLHPNMHGKLIVQ